MRKVIIASICLFIVFAIHAQEVTTYTTTPSNGGLAVNSAGSVFVTNESDVIYKIDDKGLPMEYISNNPHITRAVGLAFSPVDNALYVANAPLDRLGWVVKIDLGGKTSIVADSIAIPTCLTFDDKGQLYVVDHFNKTWKINTLGIKSLLIENQILNRPNGIAWAKDKLYVASAHDGNIYWMPTNKGANPDITWLAKIDGLKQPWACGHMVYSNNALYITNGDDKIHKITLDGEVTDYAGSGTKGHKDGDLLEAQFTAPNGIATNGIATNSESTVLYVAEYNMGRIRAISIAPN